MMTTSVKLPTIVRLTIVMVCLRVKKLYSSRLIVSLFVAVVVVVVADDDVVEAGFVTGQYFQHITLFSTLS